MNKTSNVIVNILTEFKGLNNVKKAESAFNGLGESIKRLASAYAVEEVVRKSLEAFKAESAAVALLTNSLANLGIQYTDIQPVIEKNLNTFTDLGFKSADTLGALTKLTTALGNPAKALDVLATTADLARYKNMSLAETAVLVGKAIAGNSRAFADLGLKIDKNLDPQNAFNKLLEQAQLKAGGAAKAYAGTLAGSLDIAAAKADKASVSLGQALAPAVKKLADFAVTYLVPVLDAIANNITPIFAMVGAIAALTFGMKALGIASAIAAGEMALNPVFAGGALVGASVFGLKGIWSAIKSIPDVFKNMGLSIIGRTTGTGATATGKKTEDVKKLTDAEKLLAQLDKQWNADSLKAANAQKAADAAKIKAEKEKLALEKAKQVLQASGKVLDVQQAQIVAALMASNDPAVIDRLKLQQALLNDNADAAGVLSQKILEAQKEILTLQGKDPFANWGTQTAIDQINNLITALQNLGIAKAAVGLSGTSAAGTQYTGGTMLASGAIVGVDASGAGVLIPATGSPSVTNIYNIAGTVTAERGLSDIVASNSASGITQNITRLNYNFG
jgi:hypothetical protein